jgi:hypothetical protein
MNYILDIIHCQVFSNTKFQKLNVFPSLCEIMVRDKSLCVWPARQSYF